MSDSSSPAPGGPAGIEVRGLRKTFGRGTAAVDALRDVQMRVEPGEVVGLIGPSGSGKSTLLKCLGAVLTPSGGYIALGGIPVFEGDHWLFIGPDYDYLFFWLENVDVTIDGAKNNIRNVVINGGKIQRQNIDFNLLAKPLTMRFDSINTASKKAYEDDNIEKFKDMEKQLDIIIHDRIVLWAGYIRENPDNLISAFALSGFIPGLPKSEIKSLYENLSPEIKKSRYARSVSNFLKLSKDVNIGDIAEDFQLTDLKGNKVSLSNFKGKFVLLDFWASGCAPCRIENKNLLANYKKYKGKGFEIISISSDRNKDNWASASKQDSIIWPSLIDDAHVGNRYNVKFIPSTFLIDPAGRIITTDLRGEKLGEKLKELFSE